MTLTQLKHLIELEKTGSFIKASANLFLTQPALSRSIKSLEDELGGKIFDRQGRNTQLTVLGREIHKKAIELVEASNELKNTGTKMKKGLEGHLRIGMGSGPGAVLMTPVLKHCAIHYPKLHIEIIRGTTPMLVESLRNREMDALIIDARSIIPAADLHIEMIHETPGSFMCRKNHPLLKEKKITIQDLKKYPIASTPLSAEVERILIERYQASGALSTLITLKCSEISSLVDVVQDSDAILLAVRSSAPELEVLETTPKLEATAKFGFVTIRHRSESPFLQEIRTFVLERLLTK